MTMNLPHLRRSARPPMQLALAAALTLCTLTAWAETPAPARKVIVSGLVPDEASRASILARVREIYGAEMVTDRLEVGGVVPPPNWTANITKALSPELKQVRSGELQVSGTRIAIRGTVANEALRQKIPSDIATALNPTYTIDNALGVTGNGQTVLDDTLSGRVVEFEIGSATITPIGVGILDEMAAAIAALGNPRVQIIGHTDSSGDRLANIGLSLARANAVRDYLMRKGVPADHLNALGAGPDRPVTANTTAEGRAKNRRIEFRLLDSV